MESYLATMSWAVGTCASNQQLSSVLKLLKLHMPDVNEGANSVDYLKKYSVRQRVRSSRSLNMTAVTSARNCSQVKRRNVVQHHVMGNFTNYWKIICVTVPTC